MDENRNTAGVVQWSQTMAAGMFELAIVILIAAALGVAAKFLRQPILVAYLAAGAAIGAFGILSLEDHETFRVFSDLGIMFLLFLVGLEINYTSLRAVGKVSLLLGVGQVVFTSLIGYAIATAFGFAPLPSAYIAVALTFSSTIIIVRLLSEKRDTNSLYGKISIGMLLVQDMIAILLLVVLAGFETRDGSLWLNLGMTIAKGIALFAALSWVGRRLLPKAFDPIARHHELLFLVSLAWVFLLAAIVSRIGLSIEIAGFLAGLALANSSENFQIASRIRPLRDFFILVFFVILGSSFVMSSFAGLAVPLIAFSLFVLIGNPLIVFLIMSAIGYRKRTGFLAGLTVAQISEFSLVLVALGERLGHIESSVVSLVTGVGIVTITVSTYLIIHADKVYRSCAPFLKFFERRVIMEDGWRGEGFRKPVVLIGAHRTGQSIAANLPPENLLVIDFDPDVIAEVQRRGLACIFGDAADPEIFERMDKSAVRLLISTSPDFEDNMGLLQRVKLFDRVPKVIMRADDEREARALYAAGADYVLLPNFTAGQYLGKTLAVDSEFRILGELRKRDLAMLGAKPQAELVPS